MNWYLNKNLAVKISDDPPTIRLLFTPAGNGDANDPYMLADKENQCVVCGGKEDLTRHHVVPYSYRIHFEDEAKSHTSYDVLPLCVACHEKYEQEALILRRKILEELKISEHGDSQIDTEAVKAIKAAKTLKLHRDKIPEPKIEELTNRLKAYFKKEEITPEDLDKASQLEWQIVPDNYACASKKVVESQIDIDAFATRWRIHFLAVMQPKFMPQHWDVNRKIYGKDA